MEEPEIEAEQRASRIFHYGMKNSENKKHNEQCNSAEDFCVRFSAFKELKAFWKPKLEMSSCGFHCTGESNQLEYREKGGISSYKP
jgi:hypothetical protein